MSNKQTGNSSTVPTTLELFTVAETAAILGVSRKLVSQWIRQGALPAIRLGPGQRLLRIRRVDLEAFIAQGQIHPPSQHPISSAGQEEEGDAQL